MLLGGIVGIIAIFSDSLIVIGGQPLTANIITMAVFGALLMYIIAMMSLLKLRQTEPNLERPFSAPMYPIFPWVSLVIAVGALLAMAWFNTVVFVIFLVILALGYVYFRLTASQRASAPVDEMLGQKAEQ